ncbi:alkane 1-monooxygenase [Micromonospora endolithica]|uniref:Alkane 1-monooxygenase n=1 Tax=Micromonospora endolithica TaxID=230091 RepID=A0A3A9ZL27_9ACTN|nr:alkane 1-monooxygenase [Micromonospora endolithica]RKN49071.1 alkane 1-monooxygenase [Micromonospora endolithica]TWJ23218.1 alkane 1-monooxygenase [Micromonospora endolithica]
MAVAASVTPTAWRDTRRPLWPLALLVPVLPFLGWAGWGATGGAWAWWLTPAVVFGLIPAIDLLIGDDRRNPPDEAVPRLQADGYYRWLTYLYLPAQYAALVACCAVWAAGDLGPLGAAGLVATIGVVNGIAINTAHELGHKRESVERWLSKVALAPTGYGHFFVEHNRGHHTRVATPEDPASSRLGESFWAFWPRTVSGSLRSAWRLETSRFRIRGRSPWTWRNDVLNAWAMTLALYALLVIAFGPVVLPFLLLQAVVGFSLLEAVNYLEHYGLARQRTAAGRYEKVDPRHSWNSDRTVTNVFLFQLQRHSDHHANPLRRYQTLRSFDVSPQLPAGYATMLVAALVPPVWRRVMDHRVLAHYEGDLGRANVHPPALARLRRRASGR